MKKCLALIVSDVVFTMLINVKMPTTVGILTFMSRIISCSAELSIKEGFITSEPIHFHFKGCLVVFNIFIQFCKQTVEALIRCHSTWHLQHVASDLGLHCLTMSHKKGTRLFIG